MADSNSDSSSDFDYWFKGVCSGDSSATTKLLEAYFERIGRAVSGRLTSQGKRFEDQEDVANSVLRTFLRRASMGQFAQLADKDQLWKLLLTIAIRKANDYRKRSLAERRGGRNLIIGQDHSHDDSDFAPIDSLPSREGDSPEAELRAHELFESVMSRMPDEKTRDVVLLHLQGAEKHQIAELQNCSIRTVERRMQNAIMIWTNAVDEQE